MCKFYKKNFDIITFEELAIFGCFKRLLQPFYECFNFQVIVIVLALAKISFGLVQCYRTQTGVFRSNPRLSADRELGNRQNLFTQTSVESSVSNPSAPFCVDQEEPNPIPHRGDTRVPQVRIELTNPDFDNPSIFYHKSSL